MGRADVTSQACCVCVMRRGPHLVVAPASLLENWERELALWCPRLRVVTYHGAHKEMVRNQLEKWRYDVSVFGSCLFECSSLSAVTVHRGAGAGRRRFSRSVLWRLEQAGAGHFCVGFLGGVISSSCCCCFLCVGCC